MSANRSAAVLSARVARKRLDVLAKSIEAKRWPGVVSTLSAQQEVLENLLAEPGGEPSK